VDWTQGHRLIPIYVQQPVETHSKKGLLNKTAGLDKPAAPGTGRGNTKVVYLVGETIQLMYISGPVNHAARASGRGNNAAHVHIWYRNHAARVWKRKLSSTCITVVQETMQLVKLVEETIQLVYLVETIQLVHLIEETMQLVHLVEETIRLVHLVEESIQLVHLPEETIQLLHMIEETIQLAYLVKETIQLLYIVNQTI
jgi:hypothetical protein